MLKRVQIEKLEAHEKAIDSLQRTGPAGYAEVKQRLDSLDTEMAKVIRFTFLVECILLTVAAVIMIYGAELPVSMTLISIGVIVSAVHADPRKFLRANAEEE